jgi:cytochrome b pre-mRNA-processing protein 3
MRGLRSKYLKDLFIQWRGLVAAYDEGLGKQSDAVLAAAVWRNIFKASEDVDIRAVASVVAYMRRTLSILGTMDDVQVTVGNLTFENPGRELAEVDKVSKGMKEPFKDEPRVAKGIGGKQV